MTVLEVRYPDLSEEIDRRRAQRLMRETLRPRLPIVENVTEEQVELAIGAPMPATVQRRTSPRFMTRDRTTALLVRDDALALETTAYEGWEESFRPLIEEVIKAMEAVSRPDGVLRVGLRYIDEVRVPGIDNVPGDWGGYIADHLLAAASRDFIPPSLQPSVWQGLVQYRTAGDSTLTVRYGPQGGYAVGPGGSTRRKKSVPPGPFFLLDSDSFWEADDEIPEFESESIMSRCDALHVATRDFFEIAVTDRLRTEVFEKGAEG